MALAPGTRIGSYEIIGPLGAGGMGEVYRARDAKLNRDVAIKILPEVFASDPDRLARFRREAQMLASLNHPHIGHIYGFEDGAGHALILELVEGPTLADRLVEGPMSCAEALPIARQIADALEAAHEQGIVHRDLKPANIKVQDDGTVKVLDFGLAKALVAVSSGADADQMNSPTLTAHGTQMGVILGTAAYMSPEQAKGRLVDRRADIWAFGVVLYEMLSGRRAFQGDDASDALAAVLRQDVNWTVLPAEPEEVRRLLGRCLDRNIKQRLRDIGEARIVLEHPDAGASHHAASSQPIARRVIPVVIATITTAVIVGIAWYSTLKPAPILPVTRFMFALPDGQTFTGLTGRSIAVSPDGTQVAYVSDGRLHVRSLTEFDGRVVQGTEGLQAVADPVFSPDSQSIAFHAAFDGTLKRIAAAGGAAVTIASATLPFGMSWGQDGILFGQEGRRIMRVSANGGTPEEIVTVKEGEEAQGAQMLPDGRHVLFSVATGTSADRWNRGRIVVESLASSERKTLLEGGSDAQYVPTGHLIYLVGGRVFAVAFDAQRLEVLGSPVAIIEGVRRATSANGAASNVAFSGTGNLLYIPGPTAGLTGSGQLALALSDRKGVVEPLKFTSGTYATPRVSPDGRHVAFTVDNGKDAAVWIYDLSGTSAMRRATFGGNDRPPIWSPDSKRIAFQSDRDGDLAMFRQLADGTGGAERLTKPDAGTSHEPESWSPKGDSLLFTVTKGAEVSLWTLSLADGRTATFGSVRSSTRTNALFSPDGRWVAYAVTEQNRPTIYVEPFPRTGVRHQLTAEIASQPLWSPDGKELFYNPRPGAIAVVAVATKPTLTFGNPVDVPRPFQTGPPTVRRAFDITPAGKFVGLIAAGQTPAATREMNTQIRVVLNWFEELKQRVPATQVP